MTKNPLAKLLLSLAFVVVALMANPAGQDADAVFDLVVAGGRVIDPESGLDGLRDVGVRGDRIAAVSPTPLRGLDTLDARGLVVSPGFIDVHRHAHGDMSYRLAARDGVTSALELEIGAPDVDAWYRMLGPARLINFGVSAGHIGARMDVMGDKGFMLPTGPARAAATDRQAAAILSVLERGLNAGAVAVGVGVPYTPGATNEELAGVFRLAARHNAFVFAHLGNGRPGLTALLGLAEAAGVGLHVAHINSTAGDDIRGYLDAIGQARARALPVTTELYPYTAGSTLIQSALYDDWEQWPEDRFTRFEWVATGERLTRETFARYRTQGGPVISHGTDEETLRTALTDPLPMIASDGGRDGNDNPTHPRASGTFARVLGQYVREEQRLSLNDALRRMTIEPARLLERRVPEMRDRGRLRVGAFADLTVFDPATIKDQSTYSNPNVYSAGIAHVVVNGVPIVRAGGFDDRTEVQGVRVLIGTRVPGRPLRAPH